MVRKLMFRLLGAQVLLAVINAVSGLVSSFFAANYIGVDAMSAVGLFSPLSILMMALSVMMVGGATILCGKSIGQNDRAKLQSIFSTNLMVATILALVLSAVFVLMEPIGLNGILTKDEVVRGMLHKYLIGQALGTLPLLLGGQLPAFLAMENQDKRVVGAGIVYIISNVVLDLLFVVVLRMGIFGLALASSLGLWIFFAVEAQYFLSKQASLRFKPAVNLQEAKGIVTTGFPGAAANIYEAMRGFIVNALIQAYVGSVGLSAFASANYVMRIFWALPFGMLAVSRMMISVSVGEEDRQTLTDIMRTMFKGYVLLMSIVSLGVIGFAVPLTNLFYHDPANPVFSMTAWGLRLLPVSLPIAVITMHLTCYGQASGKQKLINLTSLLDGIVFMSLFTALLIPFIGMNSVYVANIMNNSGVLIVFLIYAMIANRHFPRNMEELMVIPKSFGVPEHERLDLSVQNMEEVVSISEQVQQFCLERGIDSRRSYMSALTLEEMAANVVEHGFEKDKKRHNIDIRVVHKDDNVILRIKDDCIPFNPEERSRLTDPEDPCKNIGIQMVFKVAKEVKYQNILGLNVLTITV